RDFSIPVAREAAEKPPCLTVMVWSKTWLASETGASPVTGMPVTPTGKAPNTAVPIHCRSARYSSTNLPVKACSLTSELGVGVSCFSKTDVGERQLGSSFNFEDRLGVGLKLSATQ